MADTEQKKKVVLEVAKEVLDMPSIIVTGTSDLMDAMTPVIEDKDGKIHPLEGREKGIEGDTIKILRR
nr:hypothetical protein [Cyanobacterium sp. IPPAS B-1200]